jgi:hypothetical protein
MMNLWRFSLVFTAVTMTVAMAHLMELPAKMRYEPSLWVRLHRTLYPNFGRTAGPAEAAAVTIGNRRDRWEYGHAIRAGLVTAALGALVTSMPIDGDNQSG